MTYLIVNQIIVFRSHPIRSLHNAVDYQLTIVLPTQTIYRLLHDFGLSQDDRKFTKIVGDFWAQKWPFCTIFANSKKIGQFCTIFDQNWPICTNLEQRFFGFSAKFMLAKSRISFYRKIIFLFPPQFVTCYNCEKNCQKVLENQHKFEVSEKLSLKNAIKKLPQGKKSKNCRKF